jgi:integrase
VKTPPVPAQPRTIITPEQFAALHECLPDAQSKLLVEHGLRWGELTELRVRDLDFATRMLTVSRAVLQVHPRFHLHNDRFLVKPYPKDCFRHGTLTGYSLGCCRCDYCRDAYGGCRAARRADGTIWMAWQRAATSARRPG